MYRIAAFSKKNYRIYSRISREILDKIWAKNLSIRLIRGLHFFLAQKMFSIAYWSVLSLFSKFEEDLKFLILDHFQHLFFQFDLYASIMPNFKCKKS
jgi:hypothetical protein